MGNKARGARRNGNGRMRGIGKAQRARRKLGAREAAVRSMPFVAAAIALASAWTSRPDGAIALDAWADAAPVASAWAATRSPSAAWQDENISRMPAAETKQGTKQGTDCATLPAGERLEYIGEFTVTAYCPCEICCGEWAADRPGGVVYTASGDVAEEGVTVGAPWETLPSGTVVEIAGVGRREVQDCPAGWISEMYGGRIIDVYFESHQDALEFGRREVSVWAVESGNRGAIVGV